MTTSYLKTAAELILETSCLTMDSCQCNGGAGIDSHQFKQYVFSSD